MKDNRYTRAMNTVEIGSEALDNGLKYAREHSADEKGDKVIVMKKSRTTYWKTAAVAALAVVVGVAAIIAPGYQHKRSGDVENSPNTFVVTANAEELTSYSEVVIGALDSAGGGFGTLDNGNFEIVKHLQFPVICDGTGIESVTYSLPEHSEDVQLTFVMQKSFGESVEHNGDLNTGYKTIYMPNTYAASQYTVSYDRLPKAEEFGKRENGYHSDPVILDLCIESDPKDFGYETAEEMLDSIESDNDMSIWANIFISAAEKHSDEMKLDVTANFEDGTSKTETVRLSCADALPEDDFTKVMVTGIIEE